MVRPERPRRLNSTSTRRVVLAGRRPDGRQTSAPRATSGFGKRQRRIIVERLMPYQASAALGSWSSGKRSATLRLMLPAQDDGVDDDDQEEAEQQRSWRSSAPTALGTMVPISATRGDDQEEAADVAAGVDDVADSRRTGPAVAGGQVGVVAAGGARRALPPRRTACCLRACACRPPCAWSAAAGAARCGGPGPRCAWASGGPCRAARPAAR